MRSILSGVAWTATSHLLHDSWAIREAGKPNYFYSQNYGDTDPGYGDTCARGASLRTGSHNAETGWGDTSAGLSPLYLRL